MQNERQSANFLQQKCIPLSSAGNKNVFLLWARRVSANRSDQLSFLPIILPALSQSTYVGTLKMPIFP